LLLSQICDVVIVVAGLSATLNTNNQLNKNFYYNVSAPGQAFVCLLLLRKPIKKQTPIKNCKPKCLCRKRYLKK